jgi:hypothetical protein
MRSVSQFHNRALTKATLDLLQGEVYRLLTLAAGSRYSRITSICHGFFLFSHWHTHYRVQAGLLPSRFTVPAFLLFLMARNNKQAQSWLLHFFSSLVDARSYSFAGLKKRK